MQIDVQAGNPTAVAADALIVPVFSSNGDAGLDLGSASSIDAALGGELARLAKESRFSGGQGRVFALATLGAVPARRVILAGLGARDGLSPEAIRQAWGAAATAARDAGATKVVSALPPSSGSMDATVALSAAVEGARLATYRFTKYFGTGRESTDSPAIDRLSFVGEGKVGAAVARGVAIADAVSMARDLVSEPASVLNPEEMVNRAQAVAAEHSLEITVLGPDELAEMGAGAITAVGKGSASGPRLIHLVYRPEGGAASDRQVGLVGKCITFDTGGYSIKTFEGMLQMKTDMAGGAAVLGTMSALKRARCARDGPWRYLRGGEHDLWRGVSARRYPDRPQWRYDRGALYRRRRPPRPRRWPGLHRPPGGDRIDRPGHLDRGRGRRSRRNHHSALRQRRRPRRSDPGRVGDRR